MSVDPHLESIPEQPPAVDGARRLLSDLMALVLALSSYWGVIEPTDPAWINAVVVCSIRCTNFSIQHCRRKESACSVISRTSTILSPVLILI